MWITSDLQGGGVRQPTHRENSPMIDLKKTSAALVAALTLGIGVFAVAAPTVGATASSAAPASATAPAVAAKGKGDHPNLHRLLRRKAGKLAAKTIGIPPKELKADLKGRPVHR